MTEREKERASKQGELQAEGEGEAGSPLRREPNVGLDPRILRSWPEPKADAEPTEPPRYPRMIFFFLKQLRPTEVLVL